METQINNNLISETQLKELKRFRFWAKFSGITYGISGVFLIILGIPFVSFFGVGYIFSIIGIIYMFYSILIMASSREIKNIDANSKTEDALDSYSSSFIKLKHFLQFLSLFTVLSMILFVVIFGYTLLAFNFRM